MKFAIAIPSEYCIDNHIPICQPPFLGLKCLDDQDIYGFGPFSGIYFRNVDANLQQASIVTCYCVSPYALNYHNDDMKYERPYLFGSSMHCW